MALTLNLDLPQQLTMQEGEEQQKTFEVAILGGGPAGMTAAVYLARKQLDTVMITPDLGGQVLWTSGIENYMGYQYITGPELSKKFSEQITQFPIRLAQGQSVAAIRQDEQGLFHMTSDTDKTFVSRAVIIATGKRSRPLGVPGEEEYRGKGVSYCSICDGPFFKGKSVVIAGGGNSAATAALEMIGLGSPVTMINYAQGWQADPLIMDKLKDRVTLLDNHQIETIRGNDQQVTGITVQDRSGGAVKELDAQGVFVEIGLLPNTGPFKGFVDLNQWGEINTDCFSRTSRPGVYAAGDCTSVPEKQIIIAAGDGAKAALAAYRFINHLPAE